ncbi:MAG: Crp/Fnr family transcriptional regulator [Acidiferrobacter sp.]
MNRHEKRLLAVLRELSEDGQEQVLAFAEFLHLRQGRVEPLVPTEPVVIARPEGESVVRAIKRLAASYPMLDRGKMLNETSTLMAQCVIGGRPTEEVIDDLETLFRTHFEALRSAKT